MKRRHFIPIGLLCVLMLVCPSIRGFAQKAGSAKKSSETPEQAFQLAIDAMKHDRIEDFAQMMDPEALKHFHETMISVVDMAASKRQEGQVLPMFAGVKSVAELKKFNATQFIVSLYRGVLGGDPEVKRLLAESKETILGHIEEGDEIAHVLYRSKSSGPGPAPDRTDVWSLRRSEGRWRMLLNGDLDGMAQQMKLATRKKPTFPKIDDSRIEIKPLGRVSERNGSVNVLYRTTTPIDDTKLVKLYVISVKWNESGWLAWRNAKDPQLTALIRQKLGMPPDQPKPGPDEKTPKR